jgi:hypothetical protein
MMAEGYTAPRESMARILSMRLDGQVRMMMVGFDIVVSALARAVFGARADDAGLFTALQGYATLAFGIVLQYAIFGWLIGFAARSFGGEGATENGYTVIAWQMFVTTPLTVALVWVLASGGTSPTSGLILMLAVILSFVLLAAYITEAFRFRSVAIVAGTMLGMVMAFSFILALLLPMPTPTA